MSDYLLSVAADLDREPCTCTATDRGTDTLGCPEHDPEGYQWTIDHPNGISAEEDASMARYAYEASQEARRHACPPDLIAAIERGELTQDELRWLIAWEAEQIGLTYREATVAARNGTLPKTALASDIDMLWRMLEEPQP